MSEMSNVREISDLLFAAADRSRDAAKACRDWEFSRDPVNVAETAADALDAAEHVRAALKDGNGGGYLDTRRSRFVEAAWQMLLAGTDEEGRSKDLILASRLFKAAAEA